MAQSVSELTEQGLPAFEAAMPILSQLLKAETAEREVRSTAYQLKAARFPAYRDLTGFDFKSSEINETLVRQLHRREFIDNANNIVLVGGPGTGKTPIATAIGVHAIEHHRKRVRFFSTVELVNALEQEKLQGRPGQIAHRLAYCDLVILDELGYLPFSASFRAGVRRPILLHGFDATLWPFVKLARPRRWSTHVGLEDGKHLEDGTIAMDDVSLVAYAIEIFRGAAVN